MNKRLLERIVLSPQLTLELCDCSRKLTGDRWTVILENQYRQAKERCHWTSPTP